MIGWPGRSGFPENGETTILDPEPREVRKEPCSQKSKKILTRSGQNGNHAVETGKRLDPKPRQVRKESCGRVSKKARPGAAPSTKGTAWSGLEKGSTRSRAKNERNRAVGSQKRLDPKPRQVRKEPCGRDSQRLNPKPCQVRKESCGRVSKKARPEAAPSTKGTARSGLEKGSTRSRAKYERNHAVGSPKKARPGAAPSTKGIMR
ncbi:hypothetical protein MRX96_015012 [Rhipicephalus microplus]